MNVVLHLAILCLLAGYSIAFIQHHATRRIPAVVKTFSDLINYSSRKERSYQARRVDGVRSNQALPSSSKIVSNHLLARSSDDNMQKEEEKIKDKVFLERTKHWVIIVDDEEEILWPLASSC
jgi:hypothetical protein